MKSFVRYALLVAALLASSVTGRPAERTSNLPESKIGVAPSRTRFPQDLGECMDYGGSYKVTTSNDKLNQIYSPDPQVNVYEGTFYDPSRQGVVLRLRVKLHEGGRLELTAQPDDYDKPSVREVMVHPVNRRGLIDFPFWTGWRIDTQGYGVCNVMTDLDRNHVDEFTISY